MATRKILFRGQTRHKGEKTSISGKPLPGIWVTGGIFPQNKGYERAIIYTQDPKVEKHVVYAETVGQYTGVDDVLETPVFEDDIITFWQRTDTKHMQRYKGIVKYDEALTSFTVVSCEPNRLSDPVFLWDCSDIHVVGNIFDGELSKREQEVSCTYVKCFCTIPMGSTEAYNLSCATDILSNHPCSEACELFYNGIEWKCYPDDTELNDVIAHPEQYIVIPVLFSDK